MAPLLAAGPDTLTATAATDEGPAEKEDPLRVVDPALGRTEVPAVEAAAAAWLRALLSPVPPVFRRTGGRRSLILSKARAWSNVLTSSPGE